MPRKITQKYLKEIMIYEPTTGDFYKVKCRRGDWIGKKAGTLNKKGYISISVHNKRYLAHRLAWLYMTGEWPKINIDHINGNKADNRFNNLRESNYSQDMHNQGKRKHNSSGYKGVSPHRASGKWTAQIKVNWKTIYLGCYNTPQEAYRAYCQAAKKHHGKFARVA